MSTRPWLGVSIQPDAGCGRALAPWFRDGRIEAVELTVDVLLQGGWGAVPPWYAQVVEAFSAAGRLFGHGVGFSVMSGGPATHRQQAWMDAVADLLRRAPCRRLSVHACWFEAGKVVFGAPLAPPPGSALAWSLLAARTMELSARLGCPVGVENLGFAWSARDVWLRAARWHGWLRDQPGGYLHLDLHNLWCQAATWSLPVEDLLQMLPLQSVRVVHVAGGSWSRPRKGHPPVRRDTHDGAIPESVWALLPGVVASCPQLETVVYERVPGAWDHPQVVDAELERLYRTLSSAPMPAAGPVETIEPRMAIASAPKESPERLAAWQEAILAAPTADALLGVLRGSVTYGDDFADVDERMVWVAHELVGRWSQWA